MNTELTMGDPPRVPSLRRGSGPRSMLRSMSDRPMRSMYDAVGTPALTVACSQAGSSAGESAELLQSRLRVFTALTASLYAVCFVVGWVVIPLVVPDLRLSAGDAYVTIVRVMVGGTTLVLAGAWLTLRYVRLRLFTLQVLDVAVALSIVYSTILWSSWADQSWAGALGTLFSALLALELRAALVPSPPKRTAAIALASAVGLEWCAYHLSVNDPLRPPGESPFVLVFWVFLWSAMIVAATTVTSRVVYGLQREVEQTRRLGQYTLVDTLGTGGMGSVFLARHAMLRRPTAVKLLSANNEASLARFEREVQLTSVLTHPNTIAVYDYGRTTDGVFYYAMEYVDGLSLEELVRTDGAQSPARVIHILRQIAGALDEAHRLGLIHRDVKPANILLCERGGVADVVKVVDFGLVKEVSTADSSSLSGADVIAGTPAYLAPEMIRSPDRVDARADLYGLGAVGYFLLTGGPVFDADSVVEVCGHHLHTDPEPPSARRGESIPRELERLILACLAKEPDQRPRDSRTLEHDLAVLAHTHEWASENAKAWWTDWRSSA